jgi:hypothetical protein
MILLNFTHALTVHQKNQILEMLELSNLEVREKHCTFDYRSSFMKQAKVAVDNMKLTADDDELLVMVPGHPAAAIAIVLELQRRTGNTPICVRLKRTSVHPPQFEVAEIMEFD